MSEREQTPEYEAKLQGARSRMSRVALGLVAIFGPIDTAGVLFGAGVGVLEAHVGQAAAKNYLLVLADEVGEDDGQEPGPERSH